jgi:hypothetical protein
LRLRFSRGEIDPRVLCGRTTTGTFFDGSGVLQTAAIGVPRITYDPADLSLSPGLLAEEGRTNDFLNTAVLSTQSITVTNAQRTVSFYGAGTLVLSGATSATLVGSAVPNVRTVHTFTPTSGTLTATVTGSVLNAQCEIGASASSYIPTTTTAVTRGTDNLSMTDLSWYQQSGGVLYVDYNSTNPVGVGGPFAVMLTDNPASFGSLQLGIQSRSLSNQIRAWQSTVGGGLDDFTVLSATTQSGKSAIRFGGGALVRGSANGGVVGVMPQPLQSTAFTNLLIGNTPGVVSGGSLNGIIREIAFIPNTAISDSALQQLTRP